MRIIAILQTFLLVLEVIEAKVNYAITVSELHTFEMCTLKPPSQCYSDDLEFKVCECNDSDGSGTQCVTMPRDTPDLQLHLLLNFECQNISEDTNTLSCTPYSTSDTSTSSSMLSTTSQQEHETTEGLIATTGVLVVLLILAIIGWVWTYVILKKKGTMNINKTNTSEMQTKYRNDYHNEMGSTQQESSTDQVQQDLNTEEVHDVIVNDPPGHRDMESHSNRQNQSRLNDGSQEDQTSIHFYHILEQQSEKNVELKDRKPAAAYEVPVTNMAVHHPLI